MARKRRVRPGDEIKVGNRVRYRWPGGVYEAEVIEDRGNIGVNGRRLVMIRPSVTYPDDPEPFEWPAEELTLVE